MDKMDELEHLHKEHFVGRTIVRLKDVEEIEEKRIPYKRGVIELDNGGIYEVCLPIDACWEPRIKRILGQKISRIFVREFQLAPLSRLNKIYVHIVIDLCRIAMVPTGYRLGYEGIEKEF